MTNGLFVLRFGHISLFRSTQTHDTQRKRTELLSQLADAAHEVISGRAGLLVGVEDVQERHLQIKDTTGSINTQCTADNTKHTIKDMYSKL